MRPVYAIGSNAVSSLGLDVAAHWKAICSGQSGIRRYSDESLSDLPFMASRVSPAHWQVIDTQLKPAQSLTLFEQLASFSVKQALGELEEPLDLTKTAFIFATTKGNIELLGRVPDERLLLHNTAQIIAREHGLIKPFVISQACISGVVALQFGLRLLLSGRYNNAIVTGCDRVSKFVLSGFRSFQAVSDEACRPFDVRRNGITLGEGAATIILSVNRSSDFSPELVSGAVTNDAHHISAPSRTGEELALAIRRTLEAANVASSQIDMISAHGTATIYNDEMEAKAFSLAGLSEIPLHSLKGFVGHTLGAAGILESVLVLEAIRQQMLLPSAGFEVPGVSMPVNVITQPTASAINYVLKTASGFGGGNAAILWKKI